MAAAPASSSPISVAATRVPSPRSARTTNGSAVASNAAGSASLRAVPTLNSSTSVAANSAAAAIAVRSSTPAIREARNTPATANAPKTAFTIRSASQVDVPASIVTGANSSGCSGVCR